METGWTIKPSQINTWNKDVNYVMFVDENGKSKYFARYNINQFNV